MWRDLWRDSSNAEQWQNEDIRTHEMTNYKYNGNEVQP